VGEHKLFIKIRI